MAFRLIVNYNLNLSPSIGILPKTFRRITTTSAPLSPTITKRSQETMSDQHPHSSVHKKAHPETPHPKFGLLPLSTSGPQDCALRGSALLNTPYFNKGAAFPAEERKQFKLTGLLPQRVSTLEQQTKRAYLQYSSQQDDLAKNTFMTSLAYQNQVLYFRVSR